MQRFDATTLAQNLNSLAEVYDKKPVSTKALEVWFDTLKEFPTERVMGSLIHWPKSHQKFPTPAEVWKSCNETSIGARENKALLERDENKQPASIYGKEHIRRIMKMLAKPQCSPREFWQKRLAEAPVGSMGHRYAMEVLKVVGREPGQDDEDERETARSA